MDIIDEVMKSYPEYMDTPDVRVVDLTPDGIGAIPVLGRHNYKCAGVNTVPHIHPGMIEILCCQRGANLSFDHAGEVVPVSPGSVFAAQPETPHYLRCYPKGLSTVWIWFRLPEHGETVLGLSGEETQWLVSRLRSIPARFDATDALKHSFTRLWTLYDSAPRETTERRLMLRHAVLSLLLDTIESSNTRKADTSSARLDSLIEEMRADPSCDYNLDELAGRAAMSVAKLTTCFRRKTGLPPHAYLVFCRISAAKKLLSTTRMSIGAIADNLGFPSAQHFATQFRRETGRTPHEYRDTEGRGKREILSRK